MEGNGGQRKESSCALEVQQILSRKAELPVTQEYAANASTPCNPLFKICDEAIGSE